jgi:hypothetical protein
MNEKSITEALKKALPQSVAQDPACEAALKAVGEIEARAAKLEAERGFLERAPREGLLFPQDALKLVDVAHKLRGGQQLDALYAELRKDKPWLFTRQNSPANEKLALSGSESDRLREAITHGALSRDLQNFRPIRRAKR